MADENKSPPKCPECGANMKLQIAKKGRYKGQHFWGCSDFPNCRKIVTIEDESEVIKNIDTVKNTVDTQGETTIENVNSEQTELFSVPQKWDDRILRKGWYSEYISVGSLPSFASRLYREKNSNLIKALSQSLFLENRQKERTTAEDNNLIGSMLIKFLQRGYSPLGTVGIEKEIIKKFKLSKLVEPLDDESDISYKISDRNNLSSKLMISHLIQRDPFILDEEFDNTDEDNSLFDSPLEQKFYKEWIPNNIKPGGSEKSAANWFIPQPNLDTILQANGLQGDGHRRIDFLFSHPLGTFGIELDGGEHNPDIDQERDDALATCGIKVLRIPNTEIEQLDGPNLVSLKEKCSLILNENTELTKDQNSLLKSIEESTFASKLQFAIARSVKYGWLDSEEWLIEVKGMGKTAAAAIKDCIQLINGFDNLYGTSISPQSARVITEEGPFIVSLTKEEISKATVKKDESPDLRIGIERRNSAFHAVVGESNEDIEDIIIRPAFLPIELTVVDKYLGRRTKLDEANDSRTRLTLDTFLQNIFRKKAFRESQLDSVMNILRNIDTVILLPTGAGKSFIYQLAGLLMPGITIVIDPIVALMEDQEEGLRQYGIDRIVTLSNQQKNLKRDIRRTKNGEFQFIFLTPERLQTPAFRNALRGLAQTSMVNLAVLDEAHCVSEWGHDFRPAYLNVSRNIRTLGKDRSGESPPITALTGTASRAVLRDVLTDLDIDPSDDRCVTRPRSFDRSELKFYVRKADNPNYSQTTLSGAIQSLPEKFNIPGNEFFKSNGDKTFSGIVFVPFVAKKENVPYGLRHTQQIVEDATNENCTIYGGRNPFGQGGWDTEKRRNVRAFKYNEVPLLVSTKAYGMGIDKPNIRFTLHYGIPSSLEMFYQEAGRAGRNRKDAHCGIVFTEYSEKRTNQLLNPAISLEELRSLYRQFGENRAERDDLNRQLYFHLKSFSGQEDEISEISEIVNSIEDLDTDHSYELTFNNDNRGRIEKALYRLTRIGVFKDYEVDYGSRKFTIHINAFNLEECKEQLLSYVMSNTPGRGTQFEGELNKITGEDTKENILMLCKALIGFIYDIIERARRTALREVVLLARNSENDQSIRTRILDYLTEGVGAEQIQLLLQEEHVNLEDWIEKLTFATSPVDASELRGLSIRALDANPDHPGLLLMRSITELLCTESDMTIATQDLYTSIQSSITKYSINQNDWISTLEWLLNLSRARTSDIPFVTAIAFLRASQDSYFNEITSKEIYDLLAGENNTEINPVMNIFELSSFADNLNETVSIISETLKDEETNKLIGARA
ncbi:MAG: RecQ family ATP-dependent DNA helicase [Pseudomonadota bacterium]|nr:RecQ family ATP-dependent DNA helicase [Pseudomonadota bacterium]